jgi:hypothetical protein
MIGDTVPPGASRSRGALLLNQRLLILIQADKSPDNLGHIASSEDAQTPLLQSAYGFGIPKTLGEPAQPSRMIQETRETDCLA